MLRPLVLGRVAVPRVKIRMCTCRAREHLKVSTRRDVIFSGPPHPLRWHFPIGPNLLGSRNPKMPTRRDVIFSWPHLYTGQIPRRAQPANHEEKLKLSTRRDEIFRGRTLYAGTVYRTLPAGLGKS